MRWYILWWAFSCELLAADLSVTGPHLSTAPVAKCAVCSVHKLLDVFPIVRWYREVSQKQSTRGCTATRICRPVYGTASFISFARVGYPPLRSAREGYCCFLAFCNVLLVVSPGQRQGASVMPEVTQLTEYPSCVQDGPKGHPVPVGAAFLSVP